VYFLLNAIQWRYSDKLFRTSKEHLAPMTHMTKRVATLACQVFDRGTGKDGRPKAEDKDYALFHSHIQVAQLLKTGGEWHNALLFAQKAIELSRVAISSPVDKIDMDLVYLYECESLVTTAEVLCNLGRVGDAEPLLQSGLQNQLSRATSLSYSYNLIKGILLLRGYLAEVLTRWLGRHAGAYGELQQLRQEVLPLLSTHAAEKDIIDDIKMNFISDYWTKSSDCLFKLGRGEEAYQWDEEVLQLAGDFLPNTGFMSTYFPTSPLYATSVPNLRAARLWLRDWEKNQKIEDGKIAEMPFESQMLLLAAVSHEAERLKVYARAREDMSFYIFSSDRERVAQELLVSFAKQLLSTNVLQMGYLNKIACRIACVYEADLEENRAIEEALREAVLEEVREESMAARRVDEAAEELGKMTVSKKKKKKKRGGRRGKKGGTTSAGTGEGTEADLTDEKEGKE
jgi:tetratricopeptide (TPR) repeat protein